MFSMGAGPIYNVVDVEATCWRREPAGISEIIQVGIVEIAEQKDRRYVVTQMDSYYIRPTQSSSLSEFCVSLTGLTDELIFGEKAMEFGEAASILREKYKSHKRMWFCWGNYDARQFEKDSKLNSIQNPMSSQSINFKAMFSVFYRRKTMGLSKACALAGNEFIGNPHDGLDDALNLSTLVIDSLNACVRRP